MLECFWQRWDVRGLMIGHGEEGMLQAISGGSADEYQAPRLDVGVRRRVPRIMRDGRYARLASPANTRS
jgi:hypothetical protein